MSREPPGATDPATVLGRLRGGPGSGCWDAGLLPGDAGSPRTPHGSPVTVGPWDAYCSRGDSRVQHPGVPLRVGGTLNASWVLLGTPIPPGGGGLVSTLSGWVGAAGCPSAAVGSPLQRGPPYSRSR